MRAEQQECARAAMARARTDARVLEEALASVEQRMAPRFELIRLSPATHRERLSEPAAAAQPSADFLDEVRAASRSGRHGEAASSAQARGHILHRDSGGKGFTTKLRHRRQGTVGFIESTRGLAKQTRTPGHMKERRRSTADPAVRSRRASRPTATQPQETPSSNPPARVGHVSRWAESIPIGTVQKERDPPPSFPTSSFPGSSIARKAARHRFENLPGGARSRLFGAKLVAAEMCGL